MPGCRTAVPPGLGHYETVTAGVHDTPLQSARTEQPPRRSMRVTRSDTDDRDSRYNTIGGDGADLIVRRRCRQWPTCSSDAWTGQKATPDPRLLRKRKHFTPAEELAPAMTLMTRTCKGHRQSDAYRDEQVHIALKLVAPFLYTNLKAVIAAITLCEQ